MSAMEYCFLEKKIYNNLNCSIFLNRDCPERFLPEHVVAGDDGRTTEAAQTGLIPIIDDKSAVTMFYP